MDESAGLELSLRICLSPKHSLKILRSQEDLFQIQRSCPAEVVSVSPLQTAAPLRFLRFLDFSESVFTSAISNLCSKNANINMSSAQMTLFAFNNS